MLIDTHAHLTWDSFKEDFDLVIQRSVDAGIKTVINIGADLESSMEAVKIDCRPLNCFSSIGLHPHETLRLTTFAQGKHSIDESIHEHMKKLEWIYQAHPEKVVAVGECGLDHHFAGSDYFPANLSQTEQIKLQKKLFLAQITLAKKLNLPLIIHCRDSWQDIFFPELKGTTGVFHSFTGLPKDAEQALKIGYYLGFSCPVTYPKNELLREIIKTTPLDKILTETDCPFLPPQSMRGQRNEPANVLEIIKVIAQVKNLTEAAVSQQILKNSQTLFPLP